MTTFRYLLARLGLSFGISRRQHHLTAAATEAHLLREAEQLLGQRAWPRVEDIEEIGVEYWNVRRMMARRDELQTQLTQLEEGLDEAKEERSSHLSAKSAPQEALEEERRARRQQLDVLANERDAVVAKARDVRRLYDGLKAKLEALKAESGDAAALEATTRRMTELKEQFNSLKVERDTLVGRIEEGDVRLSELESRLEKERETHRENSSGTFQHIGESNRRIASLKAEIGLIDSKTQLLFSEIGRHLSWGDPKDARYRNAAGDQMHLVHAIRELRRSIALTQTITGR